MMWLLDLCDKLLHEQDLLSCFTWVFVSYHTDNQAHSILFMRQGYRPDPSLTFGVSWQGTPVADLFTQFNARACHLFVVRFGSSSSLPNCQINARHPSWVRCLKLEQKIQKWAAHMTISPIALDGCLQDATASRPSQHRVPPCSMCLSRHEIHADDNFWELYSPVQTVRQQAN